MIKVTLIKNGDKNLGLIVTGHAGYKSKGKDLICAAVSAVVTGGFNALRDDLIKKIILEEGYAEVLLKDSSETLETIIIQLRTIAEAYPSYLKFE